MDRHKTSPLRWGAKLLASWVVVSVIGIYFGTTIIEFIMPLLRAIAQTITDDFFVVLQWQPDNPRMVQIIADFGIPKPEIAALGINPGAKIRASTNLEHILVPLVLLFTVLICWPVYTWCQRAALLILGLPMSLLILGLTTPFLLVGRVETLLQDYAAARQILRPEPLYLDWMLFTEVGGRWLLPIILGMACVWLMRWLFGSETDLKSIRQ